GPRGAERQEARRDLLGWAVDGSRRRDGAATGRRWRAGLRERHDDPHGAAEGGRIAADVGARGLEPGEGLGEGGGAGMPGRDEGVAPARGQGRHAWLEARDPDWRA